METLRRLMTTLETSEMVRLQAQTLRKLRSEGRGPRFCRLSANRVAYDPEDVRAWLEERKRLSTADPGSGRAA
jgi:predicted DNA-binding transcriptional regulator AlpA